MKILPPQDITALTNATPVDLAEGMIGLIVETLLTAGLESRLAPKILCSVAAYVESGKPLKIDWGVYTWLNLVSPRIAQWFAKRIRQVTGVNVEVEFVHDCDVAACALAGRPRCAVLMLDSALGVGFVPPAAGYRVLAGDFHFTFL